MAIYELEKENIWFPNPRGAEADGLLAVGGDLSVERLLLAYSHGIFPWYNAGDPILWWCPHERYIIRPDRIHVSHSMAKFMRKHEIRYALNRDFADTIHRCRMKRESTVGTWIHDDMEAAYVRMYEHKFAASMEAFIDGERAGGLYGINLGKCFFGESMYSDMENGSKLALIGLAGMLTRAGYLMIDCQFHTDHLESMGGETISYDEYEQLLERGLLHPHTANT